MNRGILYAFFTYIFWGALPIYWKLLDHVPSIEIVSQRILWSFVFFSIIVSFSKGWKGLGGKIKDGGNRWLVFSPAVIIGGNWFLYIWAVTSGYIIETSLGYFISPLISVSLGVIFLKESLRKLQWIAVTVAFIGVLVMTIFYGQFPWISILLASSWSLYGLLRKKSPLNSVEGLTLETGILSIPVLFYIIYLITSKTGTFGTELNTSLLLACSGIMGGVPLLVFITAARMINLSLIGILQYIYPSIIFFVGAFMYDEILTEAKIVGFIIIWIALIIYTIDGSFYFKRKRFAAAANKF